MVPVRVYAVKYSTAPTEGDHHGRGGSQDQQVSFAENDTKGPC